MTLPPKLILHKRSGIKSDELGMLLIKSLRRTDTRPTEVFYDNGEGETAVEYVWLHEDGRIQLQ